MKFTGERMIPEENLHDKIYLEHMSRYVFCEQFIKGKVVLDIACGSGYGASYLMNKGAKKVVGIDISQESINYAKEKYQKNGIEFIQGDATKIELESASIDIVVSFETIEHLENQEQFIREVKRVMRPDGLLVISTPNALIHPKGNIFHQKELTPNEFENALLNNFKKLKMYYQDNLISNYIVDEESLRQGGSKMMNLQNLGPSVLAKEDALFIIGLASDNDLQPVIGLTSLFYDKNNEIKLSKLIMQRVYDSSTWKKFARLAYKVKKYK